MTLAQVNRTRYPVGGRFGNHIHDLIGHTSLVGVRLSHRRGLHRTGVERRLHFFGYAGITLHANIRFGQQGVGFRGPRVLGGRHVSANLMRIDGRPLHKFRLVVVRGNIGHSRGFYAVAVNGQRRLNGVFRTVANVVANAGAETTSVGDVNAIRGDFTNGNNVTYQTWRFGSVEECNRVLVR